MYVSKNKFHPMSTHLKFCKTKGMLLFKKQTNLLTSPSWEFFVRQYRLSNVYILAQLPHAEKFHLETLGVARQDGCGDVSIKFLLTIY